MILFVLAHFGKKIVTGVTAKKNEFIVPSYLAQFICKRRYKLVSLLQTITNREKYKKKSAASC